MLMRKLGSQEYDYVTEEVHNIQNQIRRSPTILIPTIEQRLQQIKNNQYKTKDGTLIKTKEGKAALEECLEFLKKQQPLTPLIMIKKLNDVALDHVNDMGEAGFSSHQGSDGSTLKTRIEKYGKWKSLLGESLSFGVYDPLEILIQLIIDDGVQGRGHRNNIFTAGFNVVGIAFGFHKKFGICGVLDYVGQFIETIKIPPIISNESKQTNFVIEEEIYPSVTPFIQNEFQEQIKTGKINSGDSPHNVSEIMPEQKSTFNPLKQTEIQLELEKDIQEHSKIEEIQQKAKQQENGTRLIKTKKPKKQQDKAKIASIFSLDINNLRKQHLPRKFSGAKPKLTSIDSQGLIVQNEKGSKAMSIRSQTDSLTKEQFQNPEKHSKAMSIRSQTDSHSKEQFQHLEKEPHQQSSGQKSSLLMYFEQKIQAFEEEGEKHQKSIRNVEIEQTSPKFSEFESQEGLDELIDALYLMTDPIF